VDQFGIAAGRELLKVLNGLAPKPVLVGAFVLIWRKPEQFF